MDDQGRKLKQVDICDAMKQMDNLLDKTFWYDRTVFEIISDGMPIASWHVRQTYPIILCTSHTKGLRI
ncbi:MAG: hypothetical protein CM15mV122_250 [uncultured marine virus]|nr:MAG: hypothetical protein CM15mV122_250 [uncultured marine virus]